MLLIASVSARIFKFFRSKLGENVQNLTEITTFCGEFQMCVTHFTIVIAKCVERKVDGSTLLKFCTLSSTLYTFELNII